MINYCNEVQGFVNYTIFNPRNTSGDSIICLYKRDELIFEFC
jgi:hypothetical protein